MARLLLLILLPIASLAQSGRYNIETVNGELKEGYVTISPYSIIIDQDSTKLTLPVTDVGEDKRTVYYILSGCNNGLAFKGYAMLTGNTIEIIDTKHNRYYSTLFIELRARQSYSATRYLIDYER